MMNESFGETRTGNGAAGPGPSGASAGDYSRLAAEGVGSAAERMSGLLGRFAEAARAEACVGAPQIADGHTVVPLATVNVQAGFGVGFGGGGGSHAGEEGSGGGGGGGGGGKGSSRVVAVVDISSSGVRVEPVPDVTTLGLAVLALLGLFLLRGRRASAPVERVARGRLRRGLRRDA
jgi:MYXO-CTERM domain-containing protein